MKKEIKIRMVFMGTAMFAENVLVSLYENKYNIVGVFTQPDKPSGRKKEVMVGPVKKFAQSHKIPVFQPTKFKEEDIDKIKDLKPDIFVVASYGKILPKDILEIPGFGSLNIHASLLPKYRGPSPIQNTLLNGESETGITVILMNEGVDTGDIIAQEKINIDPDETAEELRLKLSKLGAEVILKILPSWVNQKIKPAKQKDEGAKLCQLIERSDGHIVWEDEASNIFNKYRAFYPWPGVFAYWDNDGNKERIKLTKISLNTADIEGRKLSGEIVKVENNVSVTTQKGSINLEEVQPEGGKPMPINDFINGHSNFVGNTLK